MLYILCDNSSKMRYTMSEKELSKRGGGGGGGSRCSYGSEAWMGFLFGCSQSGNVRTRMFYKVYLISQHITYFGQR